MEKKTEDRETRPSWGKFDEDGTYVLTVDAEQLGAKLDIPPNIIRLAAQKGYPPEYLMSGRTNPYTTERLREAGIDWGPVLIQVRGEGAIEKNGPPALPPKTTVEMLSPAERQDYRRRLEKYIEETKDPVFKVVARGTLKKLGVQNTAERIETNPSGVKKELRRPGELPLMLHRVIGYKIGHILLARAMHRQDVRERQEKAKKEGLRLGPTHEDGLLRLGLPRTRRHLSYIKHHDENIRVLRNKLNFINNHEYKGEDKKAARRDLAELIERAKQRQKALAAKKTHHEDVYVHKKVKESLDDYNKTKAAGA